MDAGALGPFELGPHFRLEETEEGGALGGCAQARPELRERALHTHAAALGVGPGQEIELPLSGEAPVMAHRVGILVHRAVDFRELQELVGRAGGVRDLRAQEIRQALSETGVEHPAGEMGRQLLLRRPEFRRLSQRRESRGLEHGSRREAQGLQLGDEADEIVLELGGGLAEIQPGAGQRLLGPEHLGRAAHAQVPREEGPAEILFQGFGDRVLTLQQPGFVLDPFHQEVEAQGELLHPSLGEEFLAQGVGEHALQSPFDGPRVRGLEEDPSGEPSPEHAESPDRGEPLVAHAFGDDIGPDLGHEVVLVAKARGTLVEERARELLHGPVLGLGDEARRELGEVRLGPGGVGRDQAGQGLRGLIGGDPQKSLEFHGLRLDALAHPGLELLEMPLEMSGLRLGLSALGPAQEPDVGLELGDEDAPLGPGRGHGVLVYPVRLLPAQAGEGEQDLRRGIRAAQTHLDPAFEEAPADGVAPERGVRVVIPDRGHGAAAHDLRGEDFGVGGRAEAPSPPGGVHDAGGQPASSGRRHEPPPGLAHQPDPPQRATRCSHRREPAFRAGFGGRPSAAWRGESARLGPARFEVLAVGLPARPLPGSGCVPRRTSGLAMPSSESALMSLPGARDQETGSRRSSSS